MSKRTLHDLPATYGCRIDELVKEYADELRDYVLSMVELHESTSRFKRIAPTSEHVLMFALEGFGRRLSERMENRRESQDAVNSLKEELGL